MENEQTRIMREYFNSPQAKIDAEKYAQELQAENERIDKRIERFHIKYGNDLDAVIERLLSKYKSSTYVKKEHRLGYQPREDLLWFLWMYAEKHCEVCEDETYFNPFTGGAYYVGSYVLSVMIGQGSALCVEKQTHPRKAPKPKTLTLELDKADLINLVCGVSPYYSVFQNPLIKNNGRFDGSHDRWNWDKTSLGNLTEENLYDIYLICKNSW